MTLSPGRMYNIAPMQFVIRAAHVAYNQQYKQRMRDQVLQQASTNVLDGKWRKKFEAEIKKGKKPIVPLWTAVQRYCEIIHKTKSEYRFRGIRNGYIRACEYFGRELPVHRISNDTLAKYREFLLDKGLKPNSANRYLSAMHSLLNCCRDVWGVIEKAPNLRPLRVRRLYRYLSKEEERRLLKAAPIELRRLAVFILGTGARKSEAVQLTWDDVHLRKGKRSWVRFGNTKNGYPHGVPLPNHVADMLREMKRERSKEMKYVFTYLPEKDSRRADGKIFIRTGIPAHYRWPDWDFRRARERANVEKVTIHTLRHTYASRLIMKGVPVFDIARLLNHACLSSTLQYIHLAPRHLEKAVSVLDRNP